MAGSRRSEALTLWTALREVRHRVGNELRREAAARWEIGIMEFELLAHLAASREALNQTQMAECLMVTLAYLTVLARNLSRAELITRCSGPDKRIQLLRLTDRGRRCVRYMTEEHDRILIALFQGLSDAGNKSLLHLLSCVKYP